MALPEARPTPRDDRPEAGKLSGTLIGFDFGTRRLGVAVAETTTGIAHPLIGLDSEANERRFALIEKLVIDWKPNGFIVGRPRHADGAEHPVARLAEKFARRLAGRFDLPVMFVDETLSSAEAERQLREQHENVRARIDVDALAAAVILQSYLDAPDAAVRLTP
jgi:putative Holliday junction resolvase